MDLRSRFWLTAAQITSRFWIEKPEFEELEPEFGAKLARYTSAQRTFNQAIFYNDPIVLKKPDPIRLYFQAMQYFQRLNRSYYRSNIAGRLVTVYTAGKKLPSLHSKSRALQNNKDNVSGIGMQLNSLNMFRKFYTKYKNFTFEELSVLISLSEFSHEMIINNLNRTRRSFWILSVIQTMILAIIPIFLSSPQYYMSLFGIDSIMVARVVNEWTAGVISSPEMMRNVVAILWAIVFVVVVVLFVRLSIRRWGKREMLKASEHFKFCLQLAYAAKKLSSS